MTTYPPLQEQDPSQPIDLSHIDYPLSERFTSAFSNEYEHQQENWVINTLPLKVTPNPDYPGSMPTTQEDIDHWKKNRPTLQNIPVGIPKFVSSAVVSMYDNDKNLSQMAEAPPSTLGKFAAFGGSLVASFADLKGDVVGAFTGGAGGSAAKNLAQFGMKKMAAQEVSGSKAAQIGSQVLSKMGEFGGFNVGYQANRETAEQQKKTLLQEPHDYLQSLQNIGTAGLDGMLLGIPAEGLGMALFGVKGVRTPDGGFEYRTPQAGEEPATQGGLFNRPEFKSIPQATKDLIGKVYRPWSKDSNITMTEEATGQMMNGQTVKIDPIMKQGMVDEGATFRQAMRDGKVNVDQLLSSLDDAHENIKSELSDALASRETLMKSQKVLQEGDEEKINQNMELSQAGILKRAKQAQFNENIMSQSPELVPQNVRQHIEVQRQIDKLQAKLDASPDEQPNKQTVRRIAELKKGQPDILTPKRELISIKKDLTDKVGTPEYASSEAYKRLTELSSVWEAAQRLKNNFDLRHDFEGRINELSTNDFITQSLRDHINDAHESVSPGEMRDYSQQLKSPGIPENDYHLEGKPEMSLDEHLNEFSDSDAKTIAESIDDPEYSRQLEESYKMVDKIPTMKEMVASIKNCLMKGEL